MNKKIISFAAPAIAALALIGGGTAYAHGMFGFGSQATPQEIATAQQDHFSQEAALLGISVDDVKNSWSQGQTLQQLAADHGINADQLKTKMQAAAQQKLKDNLQTLVTQGIITQSQADARLQFMQTQQQTNSGKAFRGHNFGMMGL